MQDDRNLEYSERSYTDTARDTAAPSRAPQTRDASPERDDPAPLSEALHIPTLIGGKMSSAKDEPAPLSDALHIPTLINEKTDDRTKPKADVPQPRPTQFSEPRPANVTDFHPSSVKRSNYLGGVSGVVETNRATTPAAPPREDTASLIGVPSNHQQTHLSGRLAKLDKVAIGVAAFMTISPLFAAMVGRMAF